METEPASPITAKTPSRIIRTIAIIAVVFAFIALVFVSLTSRPAPADQSWAVAMTTGPEDASSHYIMTLVFPIVFAAHFPCPFVSASVPSGAFVLLFSPSLQSIPDFPLPIFRRDPGVIYRYA